ncbi:imidazole glycerol phosphate synthase subunit HisF [Candidatus Collierbacteria bacterium RIFCSPHIGHO2_02_FULL_49_10]|uniref:imidazole glycerol-phosphate synthase n=1 Tax=Candidatus Collierbacteria bacterium RIFCSPHIGHO2_02_FULL_49_10 TaxID=1817723 RepID=A0A1F5EWM9_9BACT|nr:MAG: imidazole glycerol phosphate synthase subunit HisF [Candidatus Collierbacteria bacterium RIFCSPHIGHO2_02_FULL_49_10]
MLKMRIIPSLLLKDGRMVKSVRFGGYRDVGHPVTTAKIYDAQRADELIFLDISASREERRTLFDYVRQVAEECFMPLGVGGGITSVEDIRELLKSGADKVVINTAAIENPELVRKAALRFGSSTIVVSIDVKKTQDGKYEVFIRGATTSTGLDPVTWAKEVEGLGAGEILITSVDQEGTMAGYDTILIRNVAEAVSIPVIAHGGAGKLSDFKEAIVAGASAVAAASIFHFTDQSPIKTRKYLHDAGVNVRV